VGENLSQKQAPLMGESRCTRELIRKPTKGSKRRGGEITLEATSITKTARKSRSRKQLTCWKPGGATLVNGSAISISLLKEFY